MRAHIALFALVTALYVPACWNKSDDQAIRTNLVGIWAFNPREQFPLESIADNTGAYTTPDDQIFHFGPIASGDDARGEFVEYLHIPEHINSADRSTTTARWAARQRGRWYVADGKIVLQGQGNADVDVAVLSLASGALRVGGALFPCKEGCVLRPLDELPPGAASARTW